MLISQVCGLVNLVCEYRIKASADFEAWILENHECLWKARPYTPARSRFEGYCVSELFPSRNVMVSG